MIELDKNCFDGGYLLCFICESQGSEIGICSSCHCNVMRQLVVLIGSTPPPPPKKKKKKKKRE